GLQPTPAVVVAVGRRRHMHPPTDCCGPAACRLATRAALHRFRVVRAAFPGLAGCPAAPRWRPSDPAGAPSRRVSLLKIRNAADDRTVEASDFFRNHGLENVTPRAVAV